MSVFNEEKYVKEAIDSVLNQTFKDFEFIIVDDGSTDRTLEILHSYSDSRMRIFSFEENKGIPTALNYGIDRARGEYIVKIDGDDIQYPERFEKQLSFMQENPEMVLSKTLVNFFPDTIDIEKTKRYSTFKNYLEPYKNNTKTPQQIVERLKWYSCIPHTSIIIKKDIIKKFYYRDIPVAEDYDLFYRMNEEGLLMGSIDEILVETRVSANSTTVKEKKTFDKCIYFIKEKNLNQFKQNESIFIWGAGSFGQSVLEVLIEKGWNIQGFIDSDKQKEGSIIKEYKVYSTDVIEQSKKNKVIVASQPGMFEIISFLKEKGYKTEEDFMVYR